MKQVTVITFALAACALACVGTARGRPDSERSGRSPRSGQGWSRPPCPTLHPDAEDTLKSFLVLFRDVLVEYQIPPADTSEVVPVSDAAVCSALEVAVSGALADDVVTYDPSQYHRSFFATDSLFYAVETPVVLDSVGLEMPGATAMSGVLVIGRDFALKESFAY